MKNKNKITPFSQNLEPIRVLIWGKDFHALAAAHAAALLGHDVLIYGDNTPEALTAPTPLYMPLPGIPARSDILDINFIGQPDGYADKLVNQGGAGRYPEDYMAGGRTVYDLGQTHAWLIETYGSYIKHAGQYGAAALRAAIGELQPAMVFSSVPKPLLCSDRQHTILGAPVKHMAVASDREGAKITYNGDNDAPWAIDTTLFGSSWRTYGAHLAPPLSEDKFTEDVLPQHSSCDCFEDDVTFLGPLGRWDVRTRLHQSFYRTAAQLGAA